MQVHTYNAIYIIFPVYIRVASADPSKNVTSSLLSAEFMVVRRQFLPQTFLHFPISKIIFPSIFSHLENFTIRTWGGAQNTVKHKRHKTTAVPGPSPTSSLHSSRTGEAYQSIPRRPIYLSALVDSFPREWKARAFSRSFRLHHSTST